MFVRAGTLQRIDRFSGIARESDGCVKSEVAA